MDIEYKHINYKGYQITLSKINKKTSIVIKQDAQAILNTNKKLSLANAEIWAKRKIDNWS